MRYGIAASPLLSVNWKMASRVPFEGEVIWRLVRERDDLRRPNRVESTPLPVRLILALDRIELRNSNGLNLPKRASSLRPISGRFSLFFLPFVSKNLPLLYLISGVISSVTVVSFRLCIIPVIYASFGRNLAGSSAVDYFYKLEASLTGRVWDIIISIIINQVSTI